MKKAFTLIELIAVLVILAILALIVTPLVMNIIKKARISADKRSIDAYGRSIELSVATFLLDEGRFPTSISDLTIEYTGDEVICSNTQLNSDSSVYLSGCTVAGRTVDYNYGKLEEVTYQAYQVGDEVSYNNVDYYVIKASSTSEDTVTLLKAEPLTVDEVNLYGGVGTENNHVSKYSSYNNASAYNVYNKGYGGIAYYTSSTCGSGDTSGCTTEYEQSEIKYIVDAWKSTEAPVASLARLLSLDDMLNDLGMEMNKTNPTTYSIVTTDDTPTWVYDSNYYYWTMSANTDMNATVWRVGNGALASSEVNWCGNVYGTPQGCGYVRPVIVLSKSVL